MDPIAKQVTEMELGHGERIFVAPTGAKNIVSIEGSVLGGWGMLPRARAETPVVVADLLDAGTKGKSKDDVREALAARGASLAFRDGVDRMFFSGSCFPEDVPFLLVLIAECLGAPALPAREVAASKKRLLGDFEEAKTNTRSLAADALSRMLYAPTHVNYHDPLPARMKALESVTRADVASFAKRLGKRGLVLALTGDLEASKALSAAQKAFARLPEGTAPSIPERPNGKSTEPREQRVPIRDKANIDTYFGASIPFTYDDARYLPLVALSSMLGGRGLSTGHLMRTIRERDGYTYGIYAQQAGFTKNAHGMFRIWATFSPHNFDEAVAATRKEIATFLASGITERALETKKDEMTGNYLIGLSTTRGLASMLHTIGAEGKPLSYIDEYPHLLRAITVKQLKDLAPLVAPERLSLAASGSFVK